MRFDGWDFLKLIYGLRAVDLLISIQDIQDVLMALEKYPELDAKRVIQSLLIHREEDRALFETVWQFLFEESIINPPENPIEYSATCSGHDASPGSSGQGKGLGHGGVTLALSESQKELFIFLQKKNLQELCQGIPTNETDDLEEQVKYILGQSGYLSWINSVELAYARGEIRDDDWMQCLEIGDLWTDSVQKFLRRNKLYQENCWDYMHEEHWRHKPLNRFTKQEESAVHQALKQMSKKLSVRPGWRKKRASRGVINISAALRETVRGNGVIHLLEYEKPTLQRPELVVLCDVSNSVAPFSEFLLYLVKKIQLRFKRVRIFLFVDVLWDISYESWNETEDMMEQIRSWGRKNSSGFTDYGEVFKEFSKSWLNEISSRATLLILGDARNNFRPAQAEYLKAIREKVRRIYWLNPMDKNDWQDRDNILKDYVPYCSQVVRCRTINDLWGIARELI